jgi:hypothetical protein
MKRGFKIKMLSAATVLAVAALIVQAAPASAADSTYWGVIDTAAPIQGQAGVLNAAGCGSPAHVIEWWLTKSQCSGGGSNERWWLDVTSGERAGGSTPIIAAYKGNYMCMNVVGGYYAGAHIDAWNCDGGAQPNEEFFLKSCASLGDACGDSFGFIEPFNEPQGEELCLNIAGGFSTANNGIGENLILWPCEINAQNELFSLNDPGGP